MERAAVNVIQDAVRTYARKRTAYGGYKRGAPKKRSFRGAVSRLPTLWKFNRMSSTGQSGASIIVGTNSAGTTVFKNGPAGTTTSQSLSMDFAFDAWRVYIGTTQLAAITIPNYTELGALFDRFRIDKVDIYYTSSVFGPSSMGAAQSFYMPGCAYAVDTDDANPALVTDLQQYANCKYTQFGGSQVGMKLLASFKPQPSLALYTTGTTVAGAGDLVGKNLFLDAGTPTIKHYGFKMALDQLTTTSVSADWFMVNFIVKYHLTMKDLR